MIGLAPQTRVKGVGRHNKKPSCDAEAETVEVIPGGDCGHIQEDAGSLADEESTSDTLAYVKKNM